MKRLMTFVLLALIGPLALAKEIEITSPDHAYTFAYGAVFSHQVEREPLTNQLIANVTFSNYPCTGDRQPRCDETFDFRFPGLRFDAAHQIFFARVGRNELDSGGGMAPEPSFRRLCARVRREDFPAETQRSRHRGSQCQ